MADHFAVSVIRSRAVTSLDATLGALLVGNLLTMALWGIICVQTYDYFLNFNDNLLQKSVIILLWVVETFSSAMESYTIYNYTIKSYTDPTILLKPAWGAVSLPLVTGISIFIVRSMFVRRIYALNQDRRKLFILIISMAICIADFVISILITAEALWQKKSLASPQLLYLAFASGLTVDISLAIALCWLLRSARSGFHRTDALVRVILIYVVGTTLIVSVDAVLSMTFHLALPETSLSAAFFIMLSKLYVNSYLFTLNARRKLRDQETNTFVHLSRLRCELPHSGQTLSQKLSTTDDKMPSATSQITIEQHLDNGEVKKADHVV